MDENLSFANVTKKNLCALNIKKSCCRMALLYGILVFTRFAYGEHGGDDVDQLIDRLLNENDRLPPNEHMVLDDNIPFDEKYFRCTDCLRHFIRGAFISCGTITNPGSAYRIELIISDAALADKFAQLLNDNYLPSKRTNRGAQYVLYYKESESVEDFLTVIGAQKAVFQIMDTKIYKELRNNANRLTNCETANIDKTVNAAQTHIDAIKTLKNEDKIGLLPNELRVTAELRLEYPDMTLTELAAVHNPPISKSGVNHRLKKIMDFAKGTGGIPVE